MTYFRMYQGPVPIGVPTWTSVEIWMDPLDRGGSLHDSCLGHLCLILEAHREQPGRYQKGLWGLCYSQRLQRTGATLGPHI